MTDIRTKALALAALENNVELWHRSDIDQYVAVMWDKGNRHERTLKRGFENLDLLHRYAEAAKALNLEPDPVVMELFEACKAALEHFGLDWGLPGSWRDRLCRKLQSAIAKARGEEKQQ